MTRDQLDEVERMIDSVMPGGSRFKDFDTMFLTLIACRRVIEALRTFDGKRGG